MTNWQVGDTAWVTGNDGPVSHFLKTGQRVRIADNHVDGSTCIKVFAVNGPDDGLAQVVPVGCLSENRQRQTKH